MTDRWVRLHTLPGSKRYADTEAEYEEVLRRHNVVLGMDVILPTSAQRDAIRDRHRDWLSSHPLGL